MTQVYSNDSCSVQLLTDEEGGLMYEEGISTITFYKGDFASATEALRAQLTEVIASNPWLAGRLVKEKGHVCLRHPSSPSAADVDALFTSTGAEEKAAFKLKPTAPYVKTCADMYKSGKVIVGSGPAILDKDKPVAMVTVSESVAGEFALIFSLSHAIGDGRTYYEIFQMLQPGGAVRALSSQRVMAFSETMKDMCGRKEFDWGESTSTTSMFVCSSMCCGKEPKCIAFNLDDDRLAAAKAAGAEGEDVPYVSTNDILTR